MREPHSYVPILKLKRGEKSALGRLSAAFRPRITPLFEIVERQTDKTLDKHLKTAFDRLAEGLTGYPRCFIDAREIDTDGPLAAETVFSRAVGAGIAFTPVTGVSRQVDLVPALAHRSRGLALRLTRPEFENGDFPVKIETFLSHHNIAPDEIDLIIDLGAVGDMISAGVGVLTQAFMDAIPHHAHWRTLTLAACAFPRSMGVVDAHSHKLIERTDWLSWKENLHSRGGGLVRLPRFSDCVIQHPQGVEGFDPRIMQVSASIRYATADSWILAKGESTKYKLGTVQFPDLAVRLIYGQLKQYFSGAQHCAGCEAMQQAADGAPSYGSAEVWRRLGTIHHISLVMQELDSLAGP